MNKLASLPKGINDRLMTLQLPLEENKQATLISVYAPTMTNLEEVKDRFYEELESIVTSVPRNNFFLNWRIHFIFSTTVAQPYHPVSCYPPVAIPAIIVYY